MRISKRVSVRDAIGRQEPWYWGFAYHDYISAHLIFYIIPLNYVVWGIRELWFKLRLAPKGHDDLIYKKGFEDGVHSTWHQK